MSIETTSAHWNQLKNLLINLGLRPGDRVEYRWLTDSERNISTTAWFRGEVTNEAALGWAIRPEGSPIDNTPAQRIKCDRLHLLQVQLAPQPFDYQALAMRTKSGKYNFDQMPPDVVHAIEGMCNESGEMMKAMKKCHFGDQPYDDKVVANLDEEFGDALWFIACYCRGRRTTIEELMRKNIAKLKARYPAGFDSVKMEDTARDLKAEQAAMQTPSGFVEAQVREAKAPAPPMEPAGPVPFKIEEVPPGRKVLIGEQVAEVRGPKPNGREYICRVDAEHVIYLPVGTKVFMLKDSEPKPPTPAPQDPLPQIGWKPADGSTVFKVGQEVVSPAGERGVVSSMLHDEIIIKHFDQPDVRRDFDREVVEFSHASYEVTRKIEDARIGAIADASDTIAWAGFAERLRSDAKTLPTGTHTRILQAIAACAEAVAQNGR